MLFSISFFIFAKITINMDTKTALINAVANITYGTSTGALYTRAWKLRNTTDSPGWEGRAARFLLQYGWKPVWTPPKPRKNGN